MVASAAGPTVPAWLNEGLATALEPGGADWAAAQLQSSPARVPLGQLTRGFGGLSSVQARAAYAQSALAVKSLINQYGADRVVDLMRAMGRGIPFGDAFRRSLSTRLDEFAAEFAAR